MLRYLPSKNNKAQTLAVVLFALCLILLLFFTSDTVPFYGFFQIGAFGFLGAALFILTRFVLTQYIYELEGDTFTVIKQNGKTQKTVCRLSLCTAITVQKRPRTKAEKEAFVKRFGVSTSRFNFCQTLSPAAPYLLFLNFNGTKTELLLECDEAFASALASAVEIAKEEKRREEEEEEY